MGAGHRGSSWYWRPRLSPQKLKMLDTPEKAPGARQPGEGDWDPGRPPAPPLQPAPYLTVGYKCHCSSHSPLSAGPHRAALRGAWGWRRAPGEGGWSRGLGPHRHCSLGWRGHWTGSPPTAPLAGPGHSALPPPGQTPRPTPPLAVPGLWETEKGLKEGRTFGGDKAAGTGGDQNRGDVAGRPGVSSAPHPPSRLRTWGNRTRSSPTARHPATGSGTSGRALWVPRPLAVVPRPLTLLCPLFSPLISWKQRPPRSGPWEGQSSSGTPLPWRAKEGFLEEVPVQVGLKRWAAFGQWGEERGPLKIGAGTSAELEQSRRAGPGAPPSSPGPRPPPWVPPPADPDPAPPPPHPCLSVCGRTACACAAG